MAQNVLLKATGLYTFQNNLSSIPQGSLLRADNLVIDRDGVIESRRGFPLYGDDMGLFSTVRAKQLLRYKGRVLRHFDDVLEFDNGSGVFTAFDGSYEEVDAGLRIKGIEVNGNFYFTTAEGIKKISATSASGLSSDSGFITDAGGVKAIDVDGVVNYTNPGFFTENAKVAYRVVWGIRDANNNLILGAPSSRLVLTNPNAAMSGYSATVDLTINIPQEVTTSHFYQIYRTAVLEAGMADLADIDPGEEMNLVIEDFPDSADISAGFVNVNDITPEDFRDGGTPLYTNPISGDGALQANDKPPLAKDLALFKNSTYYANTKTVHNQTLSLLSVLGFVSGSTAITIANATIAHTYTFVGVQEVTLFTFDTKTNTADGSYFIIYAANDARKYVVWYDATGTTLEPTGPDTDGGIFIKVNISAATTAEDVRDATLTAMNALDNGDFVYDDSSAVDELEVTAFANGTATDAVVGAVPPGGTFSITVTTQGDGEDAGAQQVLLSNAASVAEAVDETARSLVRVINRQANEVVYADYQSSVDTVPGIIYLYSRSIEDVPFYVGISDAAVSDKWNPSLPAYVAITAISVDNPTHVTSTAHGLDSGDQIIIVDSDSTPSIDGLRTVTVLDANTFTVPVNVTIAGTTASWFATSVASANEVFPNRIYFSKPQQPEAVPATNYLEVGPKDQPIERILALRDSLFVLKSDGVYRLSGEEGSVPSVSLFDGSSVILAADTAANLNNQIYMLSTQGVATISDTGVAVISRPIEDKIIVLTSADYTNFSTASWAISYETDRAYILYTVTNVDDEVATQAFRFNTFTQTWTRWDKTNTCGIIGGDDKLYMGAGDTNFIEKERKNFTRKDFADREFAVQLPINAIDETTNIIRPASVVDIMTGDVVSQILYVTITQFNRLLVKLDDDNFLDDTNYDSLLHLNKGANLTQKMAGLVTKLNLDDDSRATYNFDPADVNTGTDTITVPAHGFLNDEIVYFSSTVTLPAPLVAGTAYYIKNSMTNTFQLSAASGGAVLDLTTTGSGEHTVNNLYHFSNTPVFATIQREYNLIIYQLNSSPGVFFTNYSQSVGTIEYEVLAIDVNGPAGRFTANFSPPWIQGDLLIYRGITCVAQYAPQTMQDVSILKHVSEGTMLFENSSFNGASIAYRSDLSRDFEVIDFSGRGTGVWGTFVWGQDNWGGVGSPTPLRTLVPRQKQRCRYIECLFEHINAREKFALYGISLTYEQNSTRAYRS